MIQSRALLLLLVIINIKLSFAQLAIIKDPDGYVNVRQDKSIEAKVIAKLFNDDIVMVYYEPGTLWREVFKTSKFGDIHGYINKSRLTELTQLESIAGTSAFRNRNGNSLSITNDTLSFSISLKPFNIKAHQIERTKEGYVQKIDGRIPWGIDGNLPKMEISGISLKIKGKLVVIPPSCYKDLFEIGLESLNIYHDNRGTTYIYFPNNSDGAGGYFGTWVIKGGLYKNRYVDTL
ncbi:SH3 domain-containing protein [Desertivirga brevis]|uniref:SH3 domain-containing protein n=1 Tax=Desertivirga brevis TaxID=2810310 RepID=UPI001A977474|nr:SH3 domain-containing protein [Pedobacter sp. SYSU D00873]